MRDVVDRLTEPDMKITAQVTVNHGQPSEKPASARAPLDALRIATVNCTDAIAEIARRLAERQRLLKSSREAKRWWRLALRLSQLFPTRRRPFRCLQRVAECVFFL